MAWKTQDDFQADVFDPQVGDVLEGTVVGVPYHDEWEKYYLVIEDDKGQEWLTKICGRLDFQIRKMKIKVGDVVRLTYNGQDNEYNAHDYVLEVWEDDTEDE